MMQQFDLFDASVRTARRAPHRPFNEAPRARGERLGALAAQRAENAAAGFRERAEAFVLAYLGEHGPTAGEVVTDAAKSAGIVPPDDRAFGPVYAALQRAGRIAFAGWCARAKGHGTGGGRLWKLAGEKR